ncbi:MAG: tyrosine-type recombinase/integrase [Ignavibacteriaceae bacterium]
MEGLTSLLEKFSLEDVEKLKVLMSLMSTTEIKDVVSLRVFGDEYFNLIKQNRSAAYYTSVKNSFAHLFDFFHSQVSIKSIGLKEAEDFITHLQRKVPKGYRVYVRTLKAAFNKAVEWGYVKENYFMKVKLPKKQQVNPAFINRKQLEEISRQLMQGNRQKALGNRQLTQGKGQLAIGGRVESKQLAIGGRQTEVGSKQYSIGSRQMEVGSGKLTQGNRQGNKDVLNDVVVIGFYTGMRLNEIVNLKWKNVNLSTRIITVGDEDFTTKGRNQRYVPICDEAMEVFLRRQKSGVRSQESVQEGGEVLILPFNKKENLIGYVFCKSNGTRFTGDYISRSFQLACRAAGMDKAIHFHSLRHSFASNLVQQGVSLYTIKELLGHSSITTTEIYSHLNMDALRDAIKTLDNNNGDGANWKVKSDINELRKYSPGLEIIITKDMIGG